MTRVLFAVHQWYPAVQMDGWVHLWFVAIANLSDRDLVAGSAGATYSAAIVVTDAANNYSKKHCDRKRTENLTLTLCMLFVAGNNK